MNKYFNIRISILSILLLSLTCSIFADTNGVWHEAEDIQPGTFGDDEFAGDFIFNTTLYATTDVIYKGTLLEDMFVDEGQVDAISQAMMQDNSIGGDELQDDITGNLNIQGLLTIGGQAVNPIPLPPTCSDTNFLQWDGSTWSCEAALVEFCAWTNWFQFTTANTGTACCPSSGDMQGTDVDGARVRLYCCYG